MQHVRKLIGKRRSSQSETSSSSAQQRPEASSPLQSIMESADFDKDLSEIAAQFKQDVKLADRSYRLKTYKQCFVGSDAVDYLVQSGATATREDAVLLGNAFVEMHLIEHVLRDHNFKDEYLFYRFVGENERGNYKIDEKTGESIKWDNFLGATEPGHLVDDDRSLQPSLPEPDFEKISDKDMHVAKHVWPMDVHNTTLLNHVHPPEWQDPAANNSDGSSTYDLVVIGAGVGGLSKFHAAIKVLFAFD